MCDVPLACLPFLSLWEACGHNRWRGVLLHCSRRLGHWKCSDYSVLVWLAAGSAMAALPCAMFRLLAFHFCRCARPVATIVGGGRCCTAPGVWLIGSAVITARSSGLLRVPPRCPCLVRCSARSPSIFVVARGMWPPSLATGAAALFQAFGPMGMQRLQRARLACCGFRLGYLALCDVPRACLPSLLLSTI